ncbi:MAG: 5-deoxy-glucuronate isomerase [Caldilineaceae bacterium]|nr:5-deoxy-glucuronate isomerase [Caldilineaceae bacterium]MBP8107906.1 5-deoxy-glucuronate isomerase [Caldilineaceae bacterium]MBP8123790.1 5-deoxy-glucuronate isomerase [Caldilineaceae bacterium]MBP9073583.1 5-deoxy-glucuronate isomerase [Caldilineaceae bacterium]
MKQYTADNLVVHPQTGDDTGLIVNVTPTLAGWETINFQARRLDAGESWSFQTGENELAIVVLGGTVDVRSDHGEWLGIGQRADVFAGMPYALYLSRNTSLTVTGVTACEFAVTWVAADQDFDPVLVTPAEVGVEIRGGGHATRQINRMLPPGFPCQRLVLVEVYTPDGNWSSYPPHKHDVHVEDAAGNLLQADLDEIYYYKIDRPEGFAIQRVYTDADSPLHQAGFPIDAAVIARNNDVVLVPEGYHPVSSPVGYNTYYLNVLAGSAQSLMAVDDPQFAWVKGTFHERDPRVPVYDVSAGYSA